MRHQEPGARKLRKYGVAVAGAILACIAASPARAAEVRVSVHIGTPPPIIVHAPPRLVYLREPAVYVAVGIPHDIFFVGGHYYNVRGDRWYRARRHGGPWEQVVYRSLPPGLRKYKVAKLRDYRDREYRVYREREDFRDSRNVSYVSKPNNRGKNAKRR
jgi:hypothetical protein